MEDWGVPDWKLGKFYPDPETTTPKEWAWQFLRRNPRYRDWWKNQALPLIQGGKYANEFGLIGIPPNPKQPTPFPPPLFAAAAIREISGRVRRRHTLTLGPREVGWVVDLSRPHELRRLQRYLDALVPKDLSKPHYGKFAIYLRVLDAKDARVSDSAIANVLYPDAKNKDDPKRTVRDDRKAAKRLRDGGYLVLLGK